MFKSLEKSLNKLVKDVESGVQSLSKQANEQWQDVNVKCHSCGTVLKVPPNTRGFACAQCGANIDGPDTLRTVEHHFGRAVDGVSLEVNKATGQTTQMQVTVPPGVKPGDTIQVPLGAGSAPFSAVVPAGVAPGQPMTVAVPSHLLPQETRAVRGQVATPVRNTVAQGQRR